ncbi:hypothetical protein POM88_033636 [Heracleum sosnowskyi]|uniref:HAT C-terminal dimerisation domain-containing protein n=1 Tax=Heracleum sosnowskyi TaxID=360622 RepID=A0AAD8HJQ0_9APIA|nr:hypothetical protein POM88_033636 [Heracleum sosnowskyi]
MDPQFKMMLQTFCFHALYPMDDESEKNLTYLKNSLNELYQEYCKEDREREFNIERNLSSQVSSSDANFTNEQSETLQGMNDYESFIRESGGIVEPMKSELEEYLSIPIITVAYESTFSAGGRVIEPHCSCLKPETVEMLLCGADWVRELYGLKKSKQNDDKDIVIPLD